MFPCALGIQSVMVTNNVWKLKCIGGCAYSRANQKQFWSAVIFDGSLERKKKLFVKDLHIYQESVTFPFILQFVPWKNKTHVSYIHLLIFSICTEFLALKSPQFPDSSYPFPCLVETAKVVEKLEEKMVTSLINFCPKAWSEILTFCSSFGEVWAKELPVFSFSCDIGNLHYAYILLRKNKNVNWKIHLLLWCMCLGS